MTAANNDLESDITPPSVHRTSRTPSSTEYCTRGFIGLTPVPWRGNQEPFGKLVIAGRPVSIIPRLGIGERDTVLAGPLGAVYGVVRRRRQLDLRAAVAGQRGDPEGGRD